MIKKIIESLQVVVDLVEAHLHVKGHHGVVEDDSDTVVEEGLTEDKEVEPHVDTYLLENCENCNLKISTLCLFFVKFLKAINYAFTFLKIARGQYMLNPVLLGWDSNLRP